MAGRELPVPISKSVSDPFQGKSEQFSGLDWQGMGCGSQPRVPADRLMASNDLPGGVHMPRPQDQSRLQAGAPPGRERARAARH